MPDQPNREVDNETNRETNPDANALHGPFQAEQYQAGPYFGQGGGAGTPMVSYGYLQYAMVVDLILRSSVLVTAEASPHTTQILEILYCPASIMHIRRSKIYFGYLYELYHRFSSKQD